MVLNSLKKDLNEGMVERLLANHVEAGVWFEFAEVVVKIIKFIDSVVGEIRHSRRSFGGERGRS